LAGRTGRATHRFGRQAVEILGLVWLFFAVFAAVVPSGPKCPACKERIQKAATVCSHCRSRLHWTREGPKLRRPEREASDEERVFNGEW
jgi:predicted amidophosphoribosyltransferase